MKFDFRSEGFQTKNSIYLTATLPLWCFSAPFDMCGEFPKKPCRCLAVLETGSIAKETKISLVNKLKQLLAPSSKKTVRALHLYFVHIIYCMVKFHWLLTLCYKKIKEIQLKIYGNQEMHWKPKLYIFSKYCNTTDAGIGNAVHHVHMAHK